MPLFSCAKHPFFLEAIAMSMIDVQVDELLNPLLITAVELARLLHVSTRTLWRLLSAGHVPAPLRFGGAVRWRVDEIKKWIADGCQMSSRRQ
jgi:excisionase family DNA binding protein